MQKLMLTIALLTLLLACKQSVQNTNEQKKDTTEKVESTNNATKKRQKLKMLR